jgi:plastocyanin
VTTRFLPVERLLMVTVLVTALVAGCGSDGEEPQSSDAPPDATLLEGDAVEVKAIDNSFQPEAARVAAGTEVTFVNDGQNDHNVVPEDEGADWAIDGDDFHPGDEKSFTFADPGVYRYYCSIHGTIDAGMPGVLVVE